MYEVAPQDLTGERAALVFELVVVPGFAVEEDLGERGASPVDHRHARVAPAALAEDHVALTGRGA
jgi:hypothetical protein